MIIMLSIITLSLILSSDAAKTGVGVADIIGKDHNQVFKTIMTTDGKAYLCSWCFNE